MWKTLALLNLLERMIAEFEVGGLHPDFSELPQTYSLQFLGKKYGLPNTQWLGSV